MDFLGRAEGGIQAILQSVREKCSKLLAGKDRAGILKMIQKYHPGTAKMEMVKLCSTAPLLSAAAGGPRACPEIHKYVADKSSELGMLSTEITKILNSTLSALP
jgi:hypothetical protein